MVWRTEAANPVYEVMLFGLALAGALKLLEILGTNPGSWANTIGRMMG